MRRTTFNLLMFCTLAALLGKLSVEGQSFTPSIGADSDKFANRSGNVDITWQYSVTDLSDVLIFCGFPSDNIVSKSKNAEAKVEPKYQGRATTIDNPNTNPRVIGFNLRNIDFADARKLSCNMIVIVGGNQIYSGAYNLKIYEKPTFVDCLNAGLTQFKGENVFYLREGQTLNSTCTVYGNPVPSLSCTLLNKDNGQVSGPDFQRTNYTSLPLVNRLLFSNTQRAATKVRCLANGGPTGTATVEKTVKVDHIASPPQNVDLLKSTYASITIKWNKPSSPGVSDIAVYLVQIRHPNGTRTQRNTSVIPSATQYEYTAMNLFKEQNYGFTVYAYNDVGQGQGSEEKSLRTIPKSPASTPVTQKNLSLSTTLSTMNSTVPTTPDTGERSSGGMSIGTIVGIVFGVIAGIVVILIVVFFVLKKRQEKEKYPQSYVEEAVDYPATENAMYSRVNKKKPMEVRANDYSTSGYPDIIHQAKPAEQKQMLANQDAPRKDNPNSTAYENSRKEYV